MKKLSLSLVKEFLTRDEMRVISGGSGSEECFSFPSCDGMHVCTNLFCPNCIHGQCYA